MVLPWLAAAWVLGLTASSTITMAGWQWAALAIVAGLAAWSTRREPRLGWAFLAVGCCFLGALRASIAENRRTAATITSHIHTTETVDLQGIVLSAPTGWGESFAFDLDAARISTEDDSMGVAAGGQVQVVAASWPGVGRGETVVIRGRLRRPVRSEGTRASAVLEAISIRRLAAAPPLHPAALLDAARGRIVTGLYRALPVGEASLVAGVLLGADEQMPESVQEAFRATGTAHILAVSGFNVTIVAAAAAAALGRMLGARRGALAAGAAVVLYTLLCGAEAAVVRAAIMACVALTALRLGRQSAALASLAAAAILMSLLDPSVIHDVGFQLSFLATLGLVVGGRPAQEAIHRWGDRAISHEGARAAVVTFVELAALSLVAQAATVPLSAYVFHRLPLTSLPANALILPAQPLLMATGAATAFASLLSQSLGTLVGWLAWPLAAYTIRVAEIFASLPGASLPLAPFPPGYIFLAYAGLGVLILAGRWPKARGAAAALVRVGGPAWLIGLAALTTLAWRAAVERPDGRLHVTAFPTGEVLIEGPTGRFVAVSTGPSPISLRESLEGHLPLTHPTLDWLILTRSDSSPKAALEALGRHRPRGILLADAAGSEDEEAGPPSHVEIVHAVAGMALDLGNGARLEFFDRGPGRTTLRLICGTAAIVVSDDARPASSSPVAGAGPSAVVLLGEGRQVAKAAGSEWPFPKPLVIVAAPLAGDPFPADLGRASPLPVMATPSQGWIRLSTDGTQLWVITERAP